MCGRGTRTLHVSHCLRVNARKRLRPWTMTLSLSSLHVFSQTEDAAGLARARVHTHRRTPGTTAFVASRCRSALNAPSRLTLVQ